MSPSYKARLLPLFEEHWKQGGRFVPARLQAALALLERLRDFPSLELKKHLSQQGSAGLKSHETYGDKALERLKLQAINKTHGRRSSNLLAWGQALLDVLGDCEFSRMSASRRSRFLDELQQNVAEPLRTIIEQDPIEVHLRGRSAEAVIREILVAAEEKGKSGDVAQYLVGAKLSLRLKREIPVYPANKKDRTSHFDPAPALGDYEIESAIIEVAIGLPDEKHLRQIKQILDKSDSEVWLLTRTDRVATWRTELSLKQSAELMKRIVVTSVETFVGQNVTELSGFSAQLKMERLNELFAKYNDAWVSKVGTPGIRIVAK